jgi:hypothetical protein
MVVHHIWRSPRGGTNSVRRRYDRSRCHRDRTNIPRQPMRIPTPTGTGPGKLYTDSGMATSTTRASTP